MIDPDELLAAAEASTFGDEYIGFCTNCGEEAYGVEPDAREYECESCGERKVYGAPELVVMGYAG